MRYDEYKSFPFPVLRDGSEDYVDGAFQATLGYSLSKNAEKIKLEANFIASEPSINKLLKTKKAKYALLVEARETYFRDLIITNKTQTEREYSGGRIKGPVTASPFIVAFEDIENFKSNNFSAEYAGKSFSIKKGSVIALDRPREFYIGQEVFAHIGTVFELVVVDGVATGEIKLSLDHEKVQIGVSSDQKKMLDVARGQSKNQAILLSGVYLPALMQVLSHMSKDAADFEDKKWYRSIKAKCDLNNLEINEDTDFLFVAQKMFAFPINLLNDVHFGSD